MTKLRQTDKQVGRRAGVSLARAQRLAGKTNAADSTSPRIYVGLGVAAIAGLVGYGLYAPNDASASLLSQTDTGFEPQIAAPVPGPAASASNVADLTDAPAPNAVRSPDTEPFRTASLGETSNAPQPSALAPREIVVAVPDCVRSIDERVEMLRSTASENDDWSEQQDNVTALVQATLDCSHAQLEIAGSLELLGTDLADLRIRWNRDDWNLDLAMIDSFSQSEAGPDPASDPSTIQFVIR